jgi:hemoglobin/transferrin/lactoferrin receptor protein
MNHVLNEILRPFSIKATASLLALIAGLGAAQGQAQGQRRLAQQPAQPAQGREATTTALDEITVTATKREERAVDALGSVSVTTRQDIRQQQPQRLGTIISRTPGVNTNENPNDPATAINIRGLQDFGRIAVTVDGARQNFQRSGHNANGAFFLDPAFVRTIDITRGPVANIYGSGAIGGVVSFETLDPKDILRPGERIAGELGGTYLFGRQSGWNGSAIGAVRPFDWAEGLIGLSFRNPGNYRDGAGLLVRDSEQDLRSGIGKIVLTPGDGHQIKLGGQMQKYEFTNGAGTPTAPRRANEVSTSNIFARYSFSRPDNPWLNLNASLYQTTTETDQTRVSGTLAQIGQSRFFNIRTTGFDINNTTKFDFSSGKAGGPTVALTYGGDYFVDRVRTQDIAGNGDETTPSGRRAVSGAFAQAHFKWSMLDVIGAVRYDQYELNSATRSSSGSRVSPKLTIGVTPFQGFQVYSTYAEGYRAPSITETLVEGLHPAPAAFRFIPNPNLRPEIGATIEAGINLKYNDVFFAGDRFRGKVSVFQNDVKDFIEGVFTDQGAPCGSPVPGACADAAFVYNNIARARLRGVEGEFVYDARSWFASVSGSTTRGDNRTNSQPLSSIYPDKISFGAGLRFFDEKLTVAAKVALTDEQKRVPTGSPTSKAYALVDLTANYQITSDARAFVTLENIGDVRFQRYRDGDRSPGFVGKLGFSTRFGT